VADASGSTTPYFLKRYTPHGGVSWDEHAEHLRLIVAGFSEPGDIQRYHIAGVDAGRQLLLAAEMPGERVTPRLDQALVWRGVGRWLARLHATHAWPASGDRAATLAKYLEPRFQQWMEREPSRAPLARRALDATKSLVADLRAPARVTLCHRDVTAGNIRVHGTAVGLIDLDDVRVDMPGVDLSQAELEISALSNAWTVLRPGAMVSRARDALREGYGAGYPEGAAFWLPHLRNIAVYLGVMMAQRSTGWRARLDVGPRYRQTIAELERTLRAIDAG
jgi:Ser/Thr protein kinase RdoA (MazF antagonist)